jgi:hypothetical protein
MNKIVINLSSLQIPDREWLRSVRPDLVPLPGVAGDGPIISSIPISTPSNPDNINISKPNDSSINDESHSEYLEHSPNYLSTSLSPSHSRVFSPTTSTSSTSPSSSFNDDEETFRSGSFTDLLNGEEEKEEEVEEPARQRKQKRARDTQEEESGVIVSYKSDQSTFTQFDFVADGAKWLTKNKQPSAYSRYYVCSNHKLTQCKAKYTITEWPNGKTETEYESHPHNHPPPSNPHLKKDVRGRIKNMIDVGASLAAIQKKCVNEAVLPLSSAVVPSMNQLKNAKYSSKNKMKGLITLVFYICTFLT